MILHLVRHGETEYNSGGLGLGRADIPLSALGLLQAQALGERFAGGRVDRVISSPLGRATATATAAAAAHGLPVEQLPALIEMDVGETEGLAFVEMSQRFPDFMRAWAAADSETVRMPGGESIADVAARAHPLLTELRESAPESVVVAVSHNFVIKVALCQLLGAGLGAFRAVQVDLGSVSTVIIRGPRLNVVALNDTCHAAALSLDRAERSL